MGPTAVVNLTKTWNCFWTEIYKKKKNVLIIKDFVMNFEARIKRYEMNVLNVKNEWKMNVFSDI